MTDKRIVHVKIVGGSQTQVAIMANAVAKLRELTNNEFEFLVTNEEIELRDIKTLINELYSLYKLTKEKEEKKDDK